MSTVSTDVTESVCSCNREVLQCDVSKPIFTVERIWLLPTTSDKLYKCRRCQQLSTRRFPVWSIRLCVDCNRLHQTDTLGVMVLPQNSAVLDNVTVVPAAVSPQSNIHQLFLLFCLHLFCHIKIIFSCWGRIPSRVACGAHPLRLLAYPGQGTLP